MGVFASVNGNVVPGDRARVSVLDNGFTFGDAVYETLRTYAGRPFHLDRHLERLRASAARLGFEAPFGDDVFGRRLDEVLARAGNDESYIRIILTRGEGDISYRFDRVKGPTLVMVVKPFEPQHVIARVRELLGGATGSPTQPAVSDIPRPAAALAPSRPVELPTRDDRPPIPEDLMDFGDEAFREPLRRLLDRYYPNRFGRVCADRFPPSFVLICCIASSWMGTLVGDPLYNPFKMNPRVKEDDVKPSPKGARPVFGN